MQKNYASIAYFDLIWQFCWEILTITLSGGNRILLIVPTVGVLAVPASWLGDRLDCVCSVRVSVVGKLRKLSWRNWFSSWVSVVICWSSGPNVALILSSTQSCENPLVGSTVRSGSRDVVAGVSVVFSALTDNVGCRILLYIFAVLNVLRSEERFTNLLRRLNSYCIYNGSVGAKTLDFATKNSKRM